MSRAVRAHSCSFVMSALRTEDSTADSASVAAEACDLGEPAQLDRTCRLCGECFPSRTKMFQHLPSCRTDADRIQKARSSGRKRRRERSTAMSSATTTTAAPAARPSGGEREQSGSSTPAQTSGGRARLESGAALAAVEREPPSRVRRPPENAQAAVVARTASASGKSGLGTAAPAQLETVPLAEVSLGAEGDAYAAIAEIDLQIRELLKRRRVLEGMVPSPPNPPAGAEQLGGEEGDGSAASQLSRGDAASELGAYSEVIGHEDGEEPTTEEPAVPDAQEMASRLRDWAELMREPAIFGSGPGGDDLCRPMQILYPNVYARFTPDGERFLIGDEYNLVVEEALGVLLQLAANASGRDAVMLLQTHREVEALGEPPSPGEWRTLVEEAEARYLAAYGSGAPSELSSLNFMPPVTHEEAAMRQMQMALQLQLDSRGLM